MEQAITCATSIIYTASVYEPQKRTHSLVNGASGNLLQVPYILLLLCSQPQEQTHSSCSVVLYTLNNPLRYGADRTLTCYKYTHKCNTPELLRSSTENIQCLY